jgi:hypothetical protein
LLIFLHSHPGFQCEIIFNVKNATASHVDNVIHSVKADRAQILSRDIRADREQQNGTNSKGSHFPMFLNLNQKSKYDHQDT